MIFKTIILNCFKNTSTEDCMYSTVYHFSQATVQMSLHIVVRLETTVKPWWRILHLMIVVWILSQPSHVLSCQPTSPPQLHKTRAGRGDPINRLELLFLLPSLEHWVLILSKRLYCAFLYTFLLVLKYLSTNLPRGFSQDLVADIWKEDWLLT